MHIQSPRFISAARSLNGIGIVYSEQDDYNSALENLMSSLKLYRKHGKEDEEYASILNNLASTYCSLDELDKSLTYFRKVEEINCKVLPSDHPNRAATLINIGNVYYKKKDYTKSLDYYMNGLKVKEKILPADHQDKIRCFHNIGLVYYQMRNHKRANDYLQIALTMAENTLPQHHVLFSDLHDHINLVNSNCLGSLDSVTSPACETIVCEH